MNSRVRPWMTAPRFAPLLGASIGAAGGGVYWLAALLWPTSIAVILSVLATTLLSAAAAGAGAQAAGMGLVGFVFAILVKYDALLALSAASLPFALPANLALGFIMVAGHAASRALLVSVSKPVSYGDLGIAFAIGFAPAVLIGIPGLAGLAAAIAARMLFIANLKHRRRSATSDLDLTLQLTEACFYLGALATWAYV
jgi:adenosylcobinamide-GDP ribazoletransferase